LAANSNLAATNVADVPQFIRCFQLFVLKIYPFVKFQSSALSMCNILSHFIIGNYKYKTSRKYKLMRILLLITLILTFSSITFAQTKDKAMPLFWIQENGKYGYIDKTGKVVIKPQFENTMGFNEGLAATKLNGKYGYIDTEGNWAIKPQFDFTYMFSDGLAMVQIDKKSAWIDKTGKIVIEPQEFEKTAIGFKEGRLAVKKGGKWGYLDKTGKMVIEAKFEDAKEFSGGVAQVVTEGHQHHWIDANGKILWSQEKKAKTNHSEKH
jgi:hypothetical protein